MSIARSAGEVIDYQIPVYGNLKSPKFRISKVLKNIISNILLKPSLYTVFVRSKKTENNWRKMLSLKWEMRQAKAYTRRKNI